MYYLKTLLGRRKGQKSFVIPKPCAMDFLVVELLQTFIFLDFTLLEHFKYYSRKQKPLPTRFRNFVPSHYKLYTPSVGAESSPDSN
jgi:hypothetical protein